MLHVRAVAAIVDGYIAFVGWVGTETSAGALGSASAAAFLWFGEQSEGAF